MSLSQFILLSNGRSGTGFICSTIGLFFDTQDSIEVELFGSDINEMKKTKEPLKKMDNYFKHLVQKFPNDIIYGFKWKPYVMDSNYIKLFSYIKKNQIKIIFNYRNPLDIFLSTSRIKQSHTKCYHYKYNSKAVIWNRNIKILLPVKDLIKKLDMYENRLIMYEKLLIENEINYMKVKYEDLSNKNIHKWEELLNFLKPNSIKSNDQRNKLINILDNPKYIKVSNKSHINTISNYEEVLNTLKNTKFEKYLNKT